MVLNKSDDGELRFGPYRLFPDLDLLLKGNQPIRLPQRELDVLTAIVKRRGAVATREEILREVWGAVEVGDAILTVAISMLRNHRGLDPTLIATLPGRGYRLTMSVIGFSDPASAAPADGPRGEDVLSSRPRLSIVVLPFTNIGGDAEQEYFVDGVTEILTTDLSRIGATTVIACSTAFTYKGKRVDLKQVGRELGVRYVLGGSVQRGGDRLRVNVQLIDAETGGHIWAERFDKHVADLFDMQDEITARLANQLGTQLVTVEARRAAHAPDPDSMDLYFQAMARWNEGRSVSQLTASRALFEHALALDPGNIEALVGIGAVDCQLGNSFMTDDRPARLAAAEAALTRVLSQTPDHAPALAYLAGVHVATNRPEQGIAEAERAIALDRNAAMAHAAMALAKSFTGRPAETEAHILEALRISPHNINAFGWMMCAGLGKFYLGRDDEALTWLRRSVETSRNYPLAYFFLAATLAELGRQNEAEAAARSGLALDPGFTVARFRFNPSSDNPTYLQQRERLCHGMRRAGIPAG